VPATPTGNARQSWTEPTAPLVPCLPKQQRRQVPRYTPSPSVRTKPLPSWRGSGVELLPF
jgi:hypothetical protein